MSMTVGDTFNEPSCFPPWPKDWCKAPGSTPPPPWGENEQRGDQRVPQPPPLVNWIFYGGLALLVFWLLVRTLEAIAELRRAG
jgi:hypothetical protein